MEKTHFRKAADSPYLSSADIVGEPILTIKCVLLEGDKSKKSADQFNTAYFVEKQLRPGEPLKPMILNSTNSRMIKRITGSPWIEDWKDVKVCVWVDPKVKMMGEIVEGLRIKSVEKSMLSKTATPKVVIPDDIAKIRAGLLKMKDLLTAEETAAFKKAITDQAWEVAKSVYEDINERINKDN